MAPPTHPPRSSPHNLAAPPRWWGAGGVVTNRSVICLILGGSRGCPWRKELNLEFPHRPRPALAVPYLQSVPSGLSPSEGHYQPLQRGDWSSSSARRAGPRPLRKPGRESFTERQYFSTALPGHLGWLSALQIGGEGSQAGSREEPERTRAQRCGEAGAEGEGQGASKKAEGGTEPPGGAERPPGRPEKLALAKPLADFKSFLLLDLRQ